ncbi:DUF6077 domain-containing protein [Culicoidibacter larvae]|uniref:Uncharacterized protein n=1 Tax=Culicoidibacter larvae TaxID=2579976 RepID=A0A5R8Q6S0_9FIRM|nr:DUF6077 domain-containing protein [Culicoidibacter larvae]TLG71109.1 hypothetical protein FEZ08_11660 [Culicoidibacter larvae]
MNMWIIQTVIIVLAIFLISHVTGSNFKKWMNIRSDWNIHYGFVILCAFFWIISVPMQLLHVSWTAFYIVMTVTLLVFIGAQVFLYFKWRGKQSFNYKRLFPLIPVLIVIAIHLFINLGAWNPDNAYGDNLFYISQSLQQIGSNSIYYLEPSTGVLGNYLPVTYLFSSWELLIAYLAVTFQLDVAIITSVAAQIIIVSIAYISVYSLAYTLFKKRAVAIWSVVFLFISILFSYNTTGKLEEYLLDGWFLFFAHVGKVGFKYIVIVGFFELFVLAFQRRKVLATFGIQFVVAFTVYILAGNSFSQLAFVNQFILLALFTFLMIFYKIKWRNFKYLLIALIPSIGSLLLFLGTTNLWEKIINIFSENSQLFPAAADAAENSTSLISDWLVQISNFFGNYYWYVPFYFIIVMLIIVFACVNYLSKKKIQMISAKEESNVFFFYVVFPLTFLAITLFNPWVMKILIFGVIEFGYKRLLGNLMLNIFVIMFLVWGVYIYTSLLVSKKWHWIWNVVVAAGILLFALFPSRLSLYQYSKTEERLDNRKYVSVTFDGQIDYQKLLDNPYKLDQVTIDIGDYMVAKPEGTLALIEYNMFYGPTYLRNYIQNIEVFNTRYTKFQDDEKQAAYKRLNAFVTKQELYDNVQADLLEQEINYVIVQTDKTKVIDKLEALGYSIETTISGYVIIKIA